VSAIDVGGAGGTSWSEVERHRAPTALRRRVAGTFAGWGIPTADSLRLAREGAPGLPLIASGGLRSGLDAAKAIALGADLAGFAAPVLRAAAESEGAVHELLAALIEELRVTMFCTGSPSLTALKRAEFAATPC
jgi:isopentenyl-diphosphate delta-isomerase